MWYLVPRNILSPWTKYFRKAEIFGLGRLNISDTAWNIWSPRISNHWRWYLDRFKGKFVQILNNQRGHWLMVSTIGCSHSTVSIYNSLYRSAGTHLKSQIASLLHTQQPTIELNFMDCQIQSGGCDCGLLAIANAMALVLGDVLEPMQGTDTFQHVPQWWYSDSLLVYFPLDSKFMMCR